MTEFTLPETQELEAVLGPAMARVGRVRGAVRIVARAPLAYASTSPSEVITCMAGAAEMRILCKYPGPLSRTEHGARRGTYGEAQVYREVLPLLGGTTPSYYGSHLDASTGETWLFLEFLPSCERLHLVSAQEAVVDAANWLGAFHARAERHLLSGGAIPLGATSRDFYLGWARRAAQYTAPLARQYPWLERECAQFASAAEVLATAPPTVVHGEFYPKNILINDGEVVPVDWESAAIGAGEIDLASLTENWDTDVIDKCLSAYIRARWPEGPPPSFASRLLAARYYWTLRWLGTNPEWSVTDALQPRIVTLGRLAEQWRSLSSG